MLAAHQYTPQRPPMRVHVRELPRHTVFLFAAIFVPVGIEFARNVAGSDGRGWPVVAYAEALVLLAFLFFVLLSFERATRPGE
jgi:hypothetical protein